VHLPARIPHTSSLLGFRSHLVLAVCFFSQILYVLTSYTGCRLPLQKRRRACYHLATRLRTGSESRHITSPRRVILIVHALLRLTQMLALICHDPPLPPSTVCNHHHTNYMWFQSVTQVNTWMTSLVLSLFAISIHNVARLTVLPFHDG
jgi:hypothetical protein